MFVRVVYSSSGCGKGGRKGLEDGVVVAVEVVAESIMEVQHASARRTIPEYYPLTSFHQ